MNLIDEIIINYGEGFLIKGLILSSIIALVLAKNTYSWFFDDVDDEKKSDDLLD